MGKRVPSSDVGVLIQDILSVAELPDNFDRSAFLKNNYLEKYMTRFPTIERHTIDERFPDPVFPDVKIPYDDPDIHTGKFSKVNL